MSVEVSTRTGMLRRAGRGRARTHARQGDRGMVTAELALGVMATILVLVFVCWAVAVAVLQVRCMDTAAETARQAARGDQAAVAVARQDAPTGAEISVRTHDDVVVVEVDLDARPGALQVPGIHLHARAETLMEPT